MLNKDFRFRPVILLLIVFAIPNVIFFLVKAQAYYYASDDFRNSALIQKKEGIRVVFNIGEIEKLQQKDAMENIESELIRIMKNSKAGEFQSKVCDQTECIFTFYGTEANRLHQVIKPVLKKYPVNSGYLYMLYDLTNSKEQVKNELY
jgi:hypothetical protein